MPSEESIRIAREAMAKAMCYSNMFAQAYLEQDRFENVLSQRVKEEKQLSEELDSHVKTDEQ